MLFFAAVQRFLRGLTLPQLQQHAATNSQGFIAQHIYPPDYQSLMDVFDERARLAPTKTFILYNGRALSYQEAKEATDKIARYLLKLKRDNNLPNEARVIVYLPQTPAVYIAMLGIWKAGMVYVPLHYDLTRLEETKARVNVLAAHVAITPQQNPPAFLPSLRFELDEFGLLPRHMSVPEEIILEKIAPNRLAYIIFTSGGSGGEPKGVMVEHKGLLITIRGTVEIFAIEEDDRVMQVPNVSFDAHIMDCASVFVRRAATLVMIPRVDGHLASTGQLPAFCLANKITHAVFTPGVLEQMSPEKFPTLKAITSTGDKITDSIISKWNSAGIRVFTGYGPTEVSIATSIAECKPNQPTHEGRPHAGITAEKDAETEELILKGYPVARGYWGKKNLSLFGGIYPTGDRVEIDEEHNLHILGRINREIKANGGGTRVSLVLIDNEIQNCCPGVIAHSVKFSEGSKHRLETFLFGIVPDLTDVVRRLRPTLLEGTIPASWKIVTSAPPLNPNGKIAPRELEKIDVPRVLASGDEDRTLTATEQKVLGYWQEILPHIMGDPVNRDTDFFNLGASSLDLSKLVELTGLALQDIMRCPTLGAIARCIDAATQELKISRLLSGNIHKSQQPVFLVHTLMGNAAIDYARFLELDWQGRAFIGIHVIPGCHHLSEMAHYYIKAIRQHQPAGPYLILGWSAGGSIGYEMARQLEKDGETVELLMIDSEAPMSFQARTTKSFAEKYLMRLFTTEPVQSRFGLSAQELNSIEVLINTNLSVSKTKLLHLTLNLLQTLRPREQEFIQTLRGIFLSMLSYQLVGVPPKHVKLITASDTIKKLEHLDATLQARLGWPLTSPLTIIPHEGNHFSIMLDNTFMRSINYPKLIEAMTTNTLAIARAAMPALVDERFTAILKARYQNPEYSKLKQLMRHPKDWPELEESYINLTIIRRMFGRASLEKNDSGNTQNLSNNAISIPSLFEAKVDGNKSTRPPQRILINGAPGVGKTLFCQYVANQWGHEKLWGTKFTYVFWIKLRDLTKPHWEATGKPTTFADLIINEFFPSMLPEEIAQFKQLLTQQPDKILVILDGYDEFNQEPCYAHIINEELLKSPHAFYLILTSRFYFADRYLPQFDLWLENKGFSEQSIQDYIKVFFKASAEKASVCRRFLENSSISHGFSHVPINLELICSIFDDGRTEARFGRPALIPQDNEPKQEQYFLSLTMLYQQIINKLWLRFKRKAVGPDEFSQMPGHLQRIQAHPELKQAETFLRAVAFESMQSNQIILDPEVLQKQSQKIYAEQFMDVLEAILLPGILIADNDEKDCTHKHLSFVHLTVQEFLAAQQIASDFSKYYCFVSEHLYHPRFYNVWRFVAGLLAQQDETDLLIQFLQMFCHHEVDIVGANHNCLLITLLEESEFSDNIRRVMQSTIVHLRNWLRSFNQFSHAIQSRILETLKNCPRLTIELQFIEILGTRPTEPRTEINALGKLKSNAALASSILLVRLEKENGNIREIVEALKELRVSNTKISATLLKVIKSAPDDEIQTKTKAAKQLFKSSFPAYLLDAVSSAAAYQGGTLKSSTALCLAELECDDEPVMEYLAHLLSHQEVIIRHAAETAVQKLMKNGHQGYFKQLVMRKLSVFVDTSLNIPFGDHAARNRLTTFDSGLRLIALLREVNDIEFQLILDFIEMKFQTGDGSYCARVDEAKSYAIGVLGKNIKEPQQKVRLFQSTLRIIQQHQYSYLHVVIAIILAWDHLKTHLQEMRDTLQWLTHQDIRNGDEVKATAVTVLLNSISDIPEKSQLEIIEDVIFIPSPKDFSNDKLRSAIIKALSSVKKYNVSIANTLREKLASCTKETRGPLPGYYVNVIGALEINSPEILDILYTLIEKIPSLISEIHLALILIEGFDKACSQYGITEKHWLDLLKSYSLSQNPCLETRFKERLQSSAHLQDILLTLLKTNEINHFHTAQVISTNNPECLIRAIILYLQHIQETKRESGFTLRDICNIFVDTELPINKEIFELLFNHLVALAVKRREWTKNYRSFSGSSDHLDSVIFKTLGRFDLSDYLPIFDSVNLWEFNYYSGNANQASGQLLAATPAECLLTHYFTNLAKDEKYTTVTATPFAVVLERWLTQANSVFVQNQCLCWYENDRLVRFNCEHYPDIANDIRTIYAQYNDVKPGYARPYLQTLLYQYYEEKQKNQLKLQLPAPA